MPAGAAWRRGFYDGVDDGQRLLDAGVRRAQLAQAGKLEEAGVDDRSLVEGWATIPDVVGNRRVGISGLGEPNEVRMVGERPATGHRPALDGALPVVGSAAKDASRHMVPVHVGDVGGGDQPCDLCCDGRGRVAALLFPALGPKPWAVAADTVGC